MPHSTIYVSPRAIGAVDSPHAVTTSGLARLFGRSPALVDVSLSVDRGSLIAFTGPNGAGKTTLLRILATAIRPSFGSATVDGLDIVRHAPTVRQRAAFLSHATGLYDDLTGIENLRFAAELLAIPRDEATEQLPAVIEAVGLRTSAGERVRGYSAGMRRRLALARVLLARPSLLLLDEPYASLDADGMALVDRLLAAWKEAGVTCLVASHQTDHLSALTDGTVRLEAGTVAEITGSGVRPARAAQPRLRPVPTGGAR